MLVNYRQKLPFALDLNSREEDLIVPHSAINYKQPAAMKFRITEDEALSSSQKNTVDSAPTQLIAHLFME